MARRAYRKNVVVDVHASRDASGCPGARPKQTVAAPPHDFALSLPFLPQSSSSTSSHPKTSELQFLAPSSSILSFMPFHATMNSP
ncbi:hypothetical protein N7468_007280 [Penicillium chermesinum]|uniref:Uncharacterized protein n=1 Tax=Penicillium chermesinum TaxID=63820 RepID=A0A9W9TM08_9EURO|nr:uncharacterized protein N7468_007280 [Penicillium chermesinum]KAJ5226055.1 hypothetical protein N7468_007280 [Penicillium chermesinum]